MPANLSLRNWCKNIIAVVFIDCLICAMNLAYAESVFDAQFKNTSESSMGTTSFELSEPSAHFILVDDSSESSSSKNSSTTTTPFDGSNQMNEPNTYSIPVPIIGSIVPDTGATIGGESVTISGTNFFHPTVTFNGIPATITFANSGTIMLVTPPHTAGTIPVIINTSEGSTTIPFTYVAPPPPSIRSLTPASGSMCNNTAVTITGNFLLNTSSVTFDGTPGVIMFNTNEVITVITPESSTPSQVSLVITTPGGVATSTYTYEEAVC